MKLKKLLPFLVLTTATVFMVIGCSVFKTEPEAITKIVKPEIAKTKIFNNSVDRIYAIDMFFFDEEGRKSDFIILSPPIIISANEE
tara:strand:- start:3316 stop:3573 length:258 start_codon:yes stop_codon:yes gene_type:complete